MGVMKIVKIRYGLVAAIFVLLTSGVLAQIGPVNPLQGQPMSERFSNSGQPRAYDGTLRCHTITWGPDYVSWFAEQKGRSADQGIAVQHTNQDVILQQLESYLNDHVCLRGTMEQVIQVADYLNSAGLSQYAPVVSMIHSFSAGGDVIVGGPNVNTVADLCNATIAAQLDGPSTALLVNVISDACGQGGADPFANVNMLWVKDFIGFQGVSSPGAALLNGNADAALVITPDAGAMTGSGGEFSVAGANIIVGTGQARRAVADVVAFRKDFISQNPRDARAYVESLLLSHEEVRQIIAGRNTNQTDYFEFMEIGAEFVLDLPGNVEEAEALFGDAEIVGMPGNVSFFTETTNPTGFEQMSIRGQALLRELGLLSSQNPFVLEQANWDFSSFDASLLDLEGVTVQPIDATRAEAAILQRDQAGTLDDSRLFCFSILFDGADQPTLTRIQQQARADSRARAESVQDSLTLRANQLGLTNFRPDQFVLLGQGLENPIRGFDENGIPVPAATQEEWDADRNVAFCVTNIQVEDTEFVPLD